MKNKVYIAADHRGVELKKHIVKYLQDKDYPVVDAGAYDEKTPCDYPQFSYKVATQVSKAHNARGILLCMTGIGHSIAANKVPGVRAALAYNKEAAQLSREHNNSNVLVVGSKFVTEKEIYAIIDTWLSAEFEGGRHLRRVKQIKKIEEEFLK